MIRSIVLFGIICAWPLMLDSQCPYRLTHTSGDTIINDVTVSVSSWGLVDIGATDEACDYTLDYFIGRDGIGGVDDGSYTFNFSPAISEVTLNFFRLDIYPNDIEEIQVFVNGNHYPIPSPGDVLDCPIDDDVASLTDEGNVRANTFTTKGAWEGTAISGTINSITVLNDIIAGDPNGAFFSIYFCDLLSSQNEHDLDDFIEAYPNPFVDQLNIKIPTTLVNPSITLFDINGKVVRIIDNIKNGNITIDRNNLTSGVYILEVTDNGKSFLPKKIIVGD